MKIGVISDTHDRLESIVYFKNLLKNENVEMIVHCGDWVSPFTLDFFDMTFFDFRVPVKSVFGNNEGDIKRIFERNSKLSNPIEFALNDVLELKVDEKKIVVYHGHDKLVLNALILSGQYNAIFTGHTHETRQELVGSTYVLNPGSTSFAASSSIIEKASVAVYDTSLNTAEVFYFSKNEIG